MSFLDTGQAVTVTFYVNSSHGDVSTTRLDDVEVVLTDAPSSEAEDGEYRRSRLEEE